LNSSQYFSPEIGTPSLIMTNRSVQWCSC